MPQTANHCTEANSASNENSLVARLRIPKKRQKRATSISRKGTSLAASDQKSISRGSNDTVCPSPVSSTRVGSASVTRASVLGTKSTIVSEKNHNPALCVCQFLNFSNASPDEIFFLLLVRNLGLKLSTFLAAKFELKYQRPLQALRAMMNESRRNYSEQNAKRKRPLSSPVSSRKRSSGA